MRVLLGVIVSYVMGSIPTAYLFGRGLKGIDIRRHGSGNMGATNVFRVLGKGPGVAVLILDVLKGVVAVTLVGDWLGFSADQRLLLAVGAVSGHNWTVFLRFKGGKGIATSLGGLIGLAVAIPSLRPVLLITLGIWFGCFLGTGIVSLSSMVAAVLLPFLMLVTGQTVAMLSLGVLLAVLVVIRHRPNIRRLLSGQEPRVSLFSSRKSSS